MTVRSKRVLTALVTALIVLIIADVLISVYAIEDGIFTRARKPLPPFGAITHPGRQGEFIEMLRKPPAERDSIGRFDSLLGWTYQESAEAKDGRYRTNSLGARGTREYPAAPAAGMTRVLCFGDSFVWCEEVADDHAWPFLLEQVDSKIEAINFGVGGYGTDQAFLRYQSLGRELGADVVVIGLLLENIGRNVNRYRPFWSLTTWLARAKPRFILEDDGLRLIPQPFESEQELLASVLDGSVVPKLSQHEFWSGPNVWTGELSSLARLAMGYLAYSRRQERVLWLETSREPYRVSLAILEAFHRMAMEDGASLAPVVIFPSRDDLVGLTERNDRYWAQLVADLEARDIPVLDLTGPLAETYVETHAEGNPRALFAGWHLSKRGNTVVAETLHNFIERELPALSPR